MQGEDIFVRLNNINNMIMLLIKEYSGESLKKKDFYSCFFFCELGLIIGVFLSLIKNTFPISFSEELNNILLFTMGNRDVDITPFLIGFSPAEFKLILSSFGIVGIALILLKFKIKRKISFVIIVAIQGILFFLMYEETKFIIFIMFAIFIALRTFVPFGKGKYFELIRYGSYFNDIYVYHGHKNKIWTSIKLILGCIGFVIAFKYLFPVFSGMLLTILFFSIVLLIWINSSENVVTNIIRKILVYAIIIPFVLLNNNTFNLSILNIALVLVAVFFSIERVINLFKELKNKIETESNRFLLNEVTDCDKLIKEKINITTEMSESISEKLLIRQIIIYWKLELSEIKELLKIYNDKQYQKESMLINGIDYFVHIDKYESLTEKAKYLEKINKRSDNEILFYDVVKEYATVLFRLGKDYGKIESLLNNDVWLFMTDDLKYILYYASLKVNKKEQAELLKREIKNFNEVDLCMSEYIN